MPTAAYYTLGCKVNQYETEKIRQEMESSGFETVGFMNEADVYVINTCTVTAIADGKSRRALRQAVRRNPDALVVATGCYAELEADAIAGIDGVDLVVPNEDKDEIPHRAASRFPGMRRNGLGRTARPRTRTRAILKVQDGCDQFCAYCAVPFARAGKRSRDLHEIVREAETLAAFGYKEIVLTGIRLGSYCSPNGQIDTGVAELAERVCRVSGIERVRLSSIEAWEVSDKLISTMANNHAICPHLHVPLQSGDDAVLARMGRPYNAPAYRRVVETARKRIPDLAVSADVMVGFPGESDDEFERSRAFAEEMEFSRLHVFRYSSRPRARAARMEGQISEQIKERRSNVMIELGERMSQEFARTYVNREVSVLAEHKRAGSGKLTGHTRNYVEVEFDGPANLAGSVVTVRASDAVRGRLIGQTVNRTGGY
ncbi:MAG: tRNA (N(6)-L-threonylcarbamoyladenosine(37)-C(2))-methylthiotransferase MtaB [Armatimonadota bacterium]|nr:tRNA (N(6)-L-threonylcarbamoyladenosine(37)-C(2))-methylthiotransferase MtaB [Armatimonadota bacterium]